MTQIRCHFAAMLLPNIPDRVGDTEQHLPTLTKGVSSARVISGKARLRVVFFGDCQCKSGHGMKFPDTMDNY